MEDLKKVTFRNHGKAHRGLIMCNTLIAACRCPGAQNGRLTDRATIVADGWENANCRVKA